MSTKTEVTVCAVLNPDGSLRSIFIYSHPSLAAKLAARVLDEGEEATLVSIAAGKDYSIRDPDGFRLLFINTPVHTSFSEPPPESAPAGSVIH